jgi:hypothetical protein
MQDPEIDDEQNGGPSLQSGNQYPVWSELAGRLSQLSALVRVQVNAHGVPALANLLMQGLVL